MFLARLLPLQTPLRRFRQICIEYCSGGADSYTGRCIICIKGTQAAAIAIYQWNIVLLTRHFQHLDAPQLAEDTVCQRAAEALTQPAAITQIIDDVDALHSNHFLLEIITKERLTQVDSMAF